jgi:hypothetical protein
LGENGRVGKEKEKEGQRGEAARRAGYDLQLLFEDVD